MAANKRMKRVVGWKENAALPDLNVKNVIAKVDTGANLASIDASDIKIVSRENVKYVKFKVMKRNNTVRKTSAPLEGYKRIKSSNGDVERRPYIKTTLLMDGISKKIELTLTDRGPMEYTMLIGRKALGKRWVVNPSISFSTSTAPKEKRSKK
ncbi:RimK/LysX family protein [Acidimicrobiia bacterium]|nr:RimK/LysX family protein [Acidimicrobiia bacterium]